MKNDQNKSCGPCPHWSYCKRSKLECERRTKKDWEYDRRNPKNQLKEGAVFFGALLLGFLFAMALRGA